jgi:hypothetical protein
MSRSSNGRSRKEGPVFVIVLAMAVVDVLSERASFFVARRQGFQDRSKSDVWGSALRGVCCVDVSELVDRFG